MAGLCNLPRKSQGFCNSASFSSLYEIAVALNYSHQSHQLSCHASDEGFICSCRRTSEKVLCVHTDVFCNSFGWLSVRDFPKAVIHGLEMKQYTATKMTHRSCAMAKGGCHPPCLEVIQRDEQKSFLFPLPGVVFHVWRTERGSKLKLGLLMCNQSPAHACWRATEGGCGMGCEGLADPRLFVHVEGAVGGHCARVRTRHCLSTLLLPAILCTEVSCSGRVPTVTGKGIGVLNLSLCPFLVWKWCELQWNGGTYWKIPLHTCRFLPWMHWAAGGLLSSLTVTEWTDFPARGCRVAVVGAVMLFLKEKKCRETQATSVYLGFRLKDAQQPDFQQRESTVGQF